METKFASGLSTEENSFQAAKAVLDSVNRSLEGRTPELGVLFVSPHHSRQLKDIVPWIQERSGVSHLIGCSGQGVIGIGQEVEQAPGICLLAAVLPEVGIETGQIQVQETLEGLAFTGLPEIPDGPATLLLLGEPYSFPAAEFMNRLDEDYPGMQVIGGMSSGALNPGEECLFLNGQMLARGAVCAVLAGSIQVRAVVSQGCRPFGKTAVITRSEENTILELGGKPSLERLQLEIESLSEGEREILRNGLHLGLAINPSQTSFNRGDFLVRNVIGIDPKIGSMALSDLVRPGQTVQFHLRDAHSASEDLELLCREACRSSPTPKGALLFSCNGRGSYLFSKPHHDASTLQRELGPIPLAGFFAAGELGPVGGRNFLHGFTASIALFE